MANLEAVATDVLKPVSPVFECDRSIADHFADVAMFTARLRRASGGEGFVLSETAWDSARTRAGRRRSALLPGLRLASGRRAFPRETQGSPSDFV